MKKIFVTGGHLTPALAAIEELEKRKWNIFYVGRKYALEGDKTISEEYKTIITKGYKFLPIFAGRIQRVFTRYTILSILKIPLGFFQAVYFLFKYSPQVILSFGGYVAVPMAIAGWIFKIPIITHEQTLSPGLANLFISKLAGKILIGWEQNQTYFPKNKTIFVGMPIRTKLFQVINKFEIPNDRPVIYITGGNLGSHSINTIIEDNLKELLTTYAVIHQCGDTEKYQDFERLQKLKNQLPANMSKYYFIFKYITDDYIGYVFKKSDILITRSGANIINEIIQTQKPSLLIPLPWSGNNEQFQNAKYLVDHNAGVLVLQQDLKQEKFLTRVNAIYKNKNLIIKNLKELNNKNIQNASVRIADVIESEVR